MNLLTVILVYLIYCVVVMVLTHVAYPHKATITGWRAFFIIPAFLPAIFMRIAFGAKHRFYRTKGWGMGIEFDD